MTVLAHKERAEYRAKCKPMPWLKDVLVTAAHASPAAANAYERLWKDLPFADEIRAAAIKASRQLPQGDDGATTSTKLWAEPVHSGVLAARARAGRA